MDKVSKMTFLKVLVPKRSKKEPEKTDQGWDESLYFKLIKQHYTISSKIIEETIDDLDGLSKSDKKQISFFTKQMIEFFSPLIF